MIQETDPASIPTSLATCRRSPNCVSSQAKVASQRVAPFQCVDSCGETLRHLRGILDSTPGVSIAVSTDTYLRVEFTTMILRFVDDLELLVDPDEQVIHVRSASRVGNWDLGANRRRVEYLRRRLTRIQR